VTETKVYLSSEQKKPTENLKKTTKRVLLYYYNNNSLALKLISSSVVFSIFDFWFAFLWFVSKSSITVCFVRIDTGSWVFSTALRSFFRLFCA